MSQNKIIINYLKSGKSITQLEALKEIGTLRLGARIFELKKSGYPIQTEMIRLSNGKHCARYFLAKKPQSVWPEKPDRLQAKATGAFAQGSLFNSTNYMDY